MKRVSMAKLCGLLLMLCSACANSNGEPGRADAGARAGGQQPKADAGAPPIDTLDQDAGPGTSLDLHFLLIAALLETERSLIARCPCLTADGHYKTMQDCVNAVSLGRLWVDCANATDLTGMDSAALRTSLRCNLEELTQRSECLMGSACNPHAVATCMSQSLGCPRLPLDVLSHVAVECGIALSH